MDNRRDCLGISETFFELNTAWLKNAGQLYEYCQSLTRAVRSAGESVGEHWRDDAARYPVNGPESLMRWVGVVAWTSQRYHQVLSQWLIEYVHRAPGLNGDARHRAQFWMRQLIEMLAPANFFWTNPKAVQRLLKSNGDSLMRGAYNWLTDLQRGDGMPEMTDQGAFYPGKNLAATPGRVVYRNPLMEVIQYAARTPTTWKTPIVLIQPWINKYYIFDLTPQNSLVNYLVSQGFTVFITSWKNPTEEMRHITFEDYLFKGALQAVQVAREISQSDQVHAAGYCIGGTLLMTLMAWLTHEHDQIVSDATLFASLLDFSQPGDLKVFVHPSALRTIEALVATDGVLKGKYLALAFRLLNPSDLIWRFVTNNYLFGEAPPRSEILFWNRDGTNLPGDMLTFYLKAFYRDNRLVCSRPLVLGRRLIDLKRIRRPLYIVGAQKDHICPWQATFQSCRLTSARVRYVLAGDGHITGIVNPPSPWSRKKYWAGAATGRRNPERWLQRLAPLNGSWWPDWVRWLQANNGAKGNPPSVGSKRYPPKEAAPGAYVHEKG